jgi:hypothetical protein
MIKMYTIITFEGDITMIHKNNWITVEVVLAEGSPHERN